MNTVPPLGTQLTASIAVSAANATRRYVTAFWQQMSSAERIGCLTRLVETGHATDAEECELLDMIDPAQVYRD